MLTPEDWTFLAAGCGASWWEIGRTCALGCGLLLGLYGIHRHDRRHRAGIAEEQRRHAEQVEERRVDRLREHYSQWLSEITAFAAHQTRLAYSYTELALVRDAKKAGIEDTTRIADQAERRAAVVKVNELHAPAVKRLQQDLDERRQARAATYQTIMSAALSITVDDQVPGRRDSVDEVMALVDRWAASNRPEDPVDTAQLTHMLTEDARAVVRAFAAAPGAA